MSTKRDILTQIELKPANRNVVDISTWRTALRSADRNNRTRLYDLYEDLLLDNILADAIDKRISAITNADIMFVDKDGKENDIIYELMKTEAFEDMLRNIMLSKFYGFSLQQIDLPDYQSHLIPFKHVEPSKSEILFDVQDESGYDYSQDDRFIFAGKKDGDFGLILKAAPFVIYKRGGFGDWAEFCEVFGMPFRVGKYNLHDEATRMELENSFRNQGGNSWMTAPEGTAVEVHDNSKSNNGELYDKFRNACNEEILIGILGQTMTTLDGASRAQGEVHLEVQTEKHKADKRFVARILNTQFINLLIARGYNVEGGEFSFTETGKSISLNDRILIDERLNYLIDIPEYYFYETYGIPKPEQSNKTKTKAKEEPKEESPSNQSKEPEKKELAHKSSFWEKLSSFFVEALDRRAPLKF
jgi:hypothetical protein